MEILFCWNTRIPFIWGRTCKAHYKNQFNRKIMVLQLTYALNHSTKTINLHKELIFQKEPPLSSSMMLLYPTFLSGELHLKR